MKIWLLRKKSITAKLLHRKIRELYNIEIHRRKYKLPKSRKHIIIINYGNINKNANINYNISNKLKHFYLLQKACLPIPKFYIDKSFIKNFPVLGRKKRHTQGKDIIFINNPYKLIEDKNSDFWTEYINKNAEYRIHVIGTYTLVCIKIKKHNDNKDDIIWNHANGYKFITYNGKYKKILSSLGIRAVKAINYNFGAVDIIRKKDKFYILEVNACPGLDNLRLNWYANNFIKYIYGEEEEKILKRRVNHE